MKSYTDFLKAKAPLAQSDGILPQTEAHPSLYPHQNDIARWACEGGRRAIFAAFGLGKTRMHLQVAKWIMESPAAVGKKYLIICPLGVRQEFTKSDGPAMGVELTYCRSNSEVEAAQTQFIITNYERVRDGNITVDERFLGAGLDEASCLRSYGSKTYQTFLGLFKKIKHRFVFTATPSPNRYKELIHYAGFLGVMDTGEALTRFFKRDSSQAGNLTLHAHMEESFWLWVSTWAVFMQSPSDLGYSDEGYKLPGMKVHWHPIEVDHKKAWKQVDSWGQSQLFLDKSSGLKEVAGVKRETIVARLKFASDLIETGGKDRHWLLWHELEAERAAIERAIDGVKTVYGSQDLEEREDLIMGFSRGEYRILATKPIIAGSGCNFQRHCSDAIFLGSTYKFNDFIQAVHRIYRFQQPNEVNIHVIYSESEEPVIKVLQEKWKQHNELVARMVEILKQHKLTFKDMKLKKSLNCNRVEVSGDFFRSINNDCVQELENWPENSVDQIVTSIPFGNQYEYTPSLNDFGHNPNNEAFFRQMEYLCPLLLKVLRPGRVACIHVKDRIRFGNVTGLAMPTVDRFSDKTADIFEKAGFAFFGRITIDTDVVRENNQTYRLGWTENSKDSTKMGVGMPEYVLLLRKLPTELDNAYADVPVKKDKAVYTRSHWQIDASSFWKSDGDRLLDPEILANLNLHTVGQIWKKFCQDHRYNHKRHTALGLELEKAGRLPASFMLFPPISLNPDIWTDILRMRVLNSEQSKRNEEHHVCPLQLDIVERLIHRYSNNGDIVLDPFAGIHTVPYQAIKMRRQGWGIELSPEYWRCGLGYCEMAESQLNVPTLFDMQEKGTELIAQ